MPDDLTLILLDAGDHLIALWLHGRSLHTEAAYRADVAQFRRFVGKPLDQVTLADLQAFADSLGELALAIRACKLSSVKSLLAFAHRLSMLPANAGAPLRLPAKKATLAQRIIGEGDVQRLIALEPTPRNRVLLRLLYAASLRVSELCSLTWRDLQERDEGIGQLLACGKGDKTRIILLPAEVWRELVSPRGSAGDVSPHWLRHAHASQVLDRGAPIHLVQATLGQISVATTGKYLHARPVDSSSRYLAV